jgi:hypothetical protein
LGKKLGNVGFYAYIYYAMIEKLNPPFMISTFRVYFPTGDFPNTTEPETTYQLEYSSSQELAHLHEEARRVDQAISDLHGFRANEGKSFWGKLFS